MIFVHKITLQTHLLEDSMSLVGCQIGPIDVIFHFQKSSGIFDNSADKKDWGLKVPSLMPIRFKIVNHVGQ